MYTMEMRSQERRKGTETGSGDAPISPVVEKTPRDTTSSSGDNDDYLFGYGNYGDPHTFAPYQLILLLIDFIFNWTMDLTHEYPLAVLVIFIFQSLAIIINLILYIMSSANQAMQVGLHKRVTIHHWLNLGICLLYISLTGWWFIWALRKSWPSVSDQFSFTWPAASLMNASLSSSPSISNSSLNIGNSTRRSTIMKNGTGEHSQINKEIIKEQFTLWSNGFIALYVCHRIAAILYYFIYLRATFLVLNTPEIDRFVEKKKNLVERFWETKKAENESKVSKKSSRKKRGILTNYAEDEVGGSRPPFSLGLQEYLQESSKFIIEGQALRQESQSKAEGDDGVTKSRSKRQILWADDNGSRNMRQENANQQGQNGDMDVEPIRVKKSKPLKPRRRRTVDVEDNEDATITVSHYHQESENNDDREENYREEEFYERKKDKDRSRTKSHFRKSTRRSSIEAGEDDEDE